MKSVILERNAYGEGQHRFHAGFLDFAKHCGFVIKVCRPYRAKTKGKVERFNGYLLSIFGIKAPPVFGVMAPFLAADFGARTGVKNA